MNWQPLKVFLLTWTWIPCVTKILLKSETQPPLQTLLSAGRHFSFVTAASQSEMGKDHWSFRSRLILILIFWTCDLFQMIFILIFKCHFLDQFVTILIDKCVLHWDLSPNQDYCFSFRSTSNPSTKSGKVHSRVKLGWWSWSWS